VLEITLIAERHTEIAVGPGFCGVKGEGLLVMSDRLAQRAGIAQGDAKAIMDPDMFRITGEGEPQIDNRLVDPAQLAIRIS
jgi:hypothetical protein